MDCDITRDQRICCAMLVFQGEKNNGFYVLYHNMKHGHDSSKEFCDFLRERFVDFFYFISHLLICVVKVYLSRPRYVKLMRNTGYILLLYRDDILVCTN